MSAGSTEDGKKHSVRSCVGKTFDPLPVRSRDMHIGKSCRLAGRQHPAVCGKPLLPGVARSVLCGRVVKATPHSPPSAHRGRRPTPRSRKTFVDARLRHPGQRRPRRTLTKSGFERGGPRGCFATPLGSTAGSGLSGGDRLPEGNVCAFAWGSPGNERIQPGAPVTDAPQMNRKELHHDANYPPLCPDHRCGVQ